MTFGPLSAAKYVPQVLREVSNFSWLAFVKLPGVEGPRWSPEVSRLFQRCVSKVGGSEVDYLCFELDGTTPSGRAS